MSGDQRYILGLSLPQLHGICVAAMVVGPTDGDHWQNLTERARATYDAYEGSKRLWIEFRTNDAASYISLDPGEWRCEKPLDAADAIVPAIEVTPGKSWRERVALAARHAQEDACFSCDTLDALIRNAQGVVAQSVPGSEQFTLMKHKLNELLASKGDEALDENVFSALFKEGVLGFQLPAYNFAVAELLLRAQLKVGFRFVGADVTEISAVNLANFLKGQPADFVNDMVDFLADAGQRMLASGKQSARAALAEPTLYEFQRRLLHAIYCYSMAMFAGKVTEELGHTAKLTYRPLVAEESFVCTMTGIVFSAGLALEGFESVVEDVEIHDDPLETTNRMLHRYSSEIFPILPERVLEIFIARAFVMHGGARCDDGLERLKRLAQMSDWSFDSQYEQSLIEHGLLDAYRATGNSEMVARTARGIASRMIVSRVLKISSPG